jgi:hypothetical protein
MEAKRMSSSTPGPSLTKRTIILLFRGKTKSLTPLTIYGTLAGLSWWVINELFLNSHGKESSYQRYLLAHSFQGGLMLATLYHPAAFGYGLIAGGAFGKF